MALRAVLLQFPIQVLLVPLRDAARLDIALVDEDPDSLLQRFALLNRLRSSARRGPKVPYSRVSQRCGWGLSPWLKIVRPSAWPSMVFE